MSAFNKLFLLVAFFVVGACASNQKVLPDPDFAPVFPELSVLKNLLQGPFTTTERVVEWNK